MNFFIRHSNENLTRHLSASSREGRGFWHSNNLTILVAEKGKYYCLDDEWDNAENLISRGYIDCDHDEDRFLYYISMRAPERVLCAAIKRKIPRNCTPYYSNINDICNIEIGYRHHDIYARFEGELETSHFEDQGFYTSWGRFVDRYEAMRIAYIAGQVDRSTAMKIHDDMIGDWELNVKQKFNMLFSEDLY